MKRCNDEFENYNNTKKSKIDENGIEWDDNFPSGDVLDDLLVEATQNAEVKYRQRNNVTIMPSYNAFIKTEHLPFSSTQFNFSQLSLPSTSTANKPPDRNDGNYEEVQTQLKTLQEKYNEKQGEVTILRTQLKQTKDNLDHEYQRKTLEINKKLNDTKKELDAVTTQLSFKEIEMTNLKRQLSAIMKMPLKASPNCSQSLLPDNHGLPMNITADNNDAKLESMLNEVHCYPLKDIIVGAVFNVPLVEKFAKLNSKHQQDLPHLPSLKLHETIKSLLKLSPKGTVLGNGTILQLDFIFPEISDLINCDVNELNSKKVFPKIRKILIVSLQFLHNLHQYLRDLEGSMHNEEIRQLDLEYLINKNQNFSTIPSFFDPAAWSSDECGIQCRQSIALIAEIFPHNSYLRDCLMHKQKSFFTQTQEDYDKYFNCLALEHSYIYLNEILSVIILIGRLRKSFNYIGVLSAACLLLSKIFRTSSELNDELSDITSQIFKEIVFARPNVHGIYYLAKVLKEASLHTKFIESLCKNPTNGGHNLKIKEKKGIALVNREFCTFQVFSLLYRDTFLSCEGECNFLRHLNVLKFIYNALNTNASWFYYQQKKHYECLFEMNKLSIEIIHLTLNEFTNKNAQVSKSVAEILQISIKILYALSFKTYKFIGNDVNIFALYNVIKKKLLKIQDIFDFHAWDVKKLQELLNNTTEDCSPCNVGKLNELLLWTGN